MSREIYSMDNIEKAKIAYKEYAKIEVMLDRDGVILRFSKCKYGEEKTIKEFENYLIGLENS